MSAVTKTAVLSKCGTYRYQLTRTWDPDLPAFLFVMLNPSTADASHDDPTIRRCMRFVKDNGGGSLLVGNLYAYRATDPRVLDEVPDPIGPRNGHHLHHLADQAGLIVAAWGANPNRGRYRDRVKVQQWGPFFQRAVYALGVTKAGHPRHPLYLPASAPLQTWAGWGVTG